MREEEITLTKEVYRHVLPNIVYPSELEKFVEKNSSRSENIHSFINRVREEISKAADTTRKTDYQIYLNELQRRTRRQQESKKP